NGRPHPTPKLHLKVLKRHGEQMRAVQRLQPLKRRLRRGGEVDAGEVGGEVHRAASLMMLLAFIGTNGAADNRCSCAFSVCKCYGYWKFFDGATLPNSLPHLNLN